MATIFGKNPAGEIIDASDGVTGYSDVIIGNAGNDKIYGLGGDDMLKGGGGADVLHGGEGIDTATYEDSGVGVQVSLQSGTGYGGTAEGDTLISIENLYGSSYGDTLIGNAGDNKLEGAGGDDVLKGGGGADQLLGGTGNDTLISDGVLDKFDGGEGIDTVDFSVASYGQHVDLQTGRIGYPHYPYPGTTADIQNVENVVGSQYNDSINGDGKDNQLSGKDGGDFLQGAAGNDKLDGGAGDDHVNGGLGTDILIGGAGADTFEFWTLNDSMVANKVIQDVIQDFETGVDKLDLSYLDFQASDLLIKNQVVDGVHVSDVGIDSNHNGKLDDGEFAVSVHMTDNHFLGAGDLIL
jgi:Ca2+-binding RTX toxin-like protein